jgi:hypothetical protein
VKWYIRSPVILLIFQHFTYSIETCSSKGNETTTGGTHNHSIRIRPEDKISGNKDNRYSNVNTDSAGYSKR